MYFASHSFVMGSPVLQAWPGGGSLLQQPAVTVAMFSVISEELAAEQKQEAQRERDSRQQRH